MRLLKARGSAEVREVASGSATQGLWLKDRKVGSQVIGEDQSRLPKRGTAEEVGRGGRQGRREYTDLGLDLSEREEQVVCHVSPLALTITEKRRYKPVEKRRYKPGDLHHFC